MAVVWKDDKGNHYLATDSGCSCPSPFENYHDIESLTRFDENSLQVVDDALRAVKASYEESKSFLDEIRDSLKAECN